MKKLLSIILLLSGCSQVIKHMGNFYSEYGPCVWSDSERDIFVEVEYMTRELQRFEGASINRRATITYNDWVTGKQFHEALIAAQSCTYYIGGVQSDIRIYYRR